jgi:hypothetical protein
MNGLRDTRPRCMRRILHECGKRPFRQTKHDIFMFYLTALCQLVRRTCNKYLVKMYCFGHYSHCNIQLIEKFRLM